MQPDYRGPPAPPPYYGQPPQQPFGYAPPPFGYGPQQPFRSTRSLLDTLRWVKLAIVLVVGLPALVIGVWVIVGLEREKKEDLIVFDNQLGAPAEVSVDGKVVEKVEAHGPAWTFMSKVALPAGAKKITVTSGGKVVSQVDLHIRPRTEKEEHGFRGLYVIGPSRGYAIAKVPYYAEAPKSPESAQLTPIATPAPLAELPRDLESFEITSLDGPFVDSESIPQGTKMVWKTQLCSYDAKEGEASLGCSGFPGTRRAR